jgi:hypothetical protein
MIMRYLILLIWMAWFVPQIYGQDVHATQFYNTPYLINTGLTGQFEGAQRYMLYQRTQWRSITTPYRSFALAGEWKNFSLKKIFWKIPNIHSGFTLISDKAGDSQFRTTNLVGQFSMPLLVQQWQIQPSLGLGLLNMHLSDAELTFDRQWTGQIFDPNSSTGENRHFGIQESKHWASFIGRWPLQRAAAQTKFHNRRWDLSTASVDVTRPIQTHLTARMVFGATVFAIHSRALSIHQSWTTGAL